MANVYKNYKPEVSIILASFNRAEYLERSVGSVLSQTYKNWELVFVDDGGSDGTFTYINALIKNDERIRYVHHRNRGLSLTRNTGILCSIGKYITFIDSDDEYEPDHLERRIDYMLHNPDIDLIHGGIEVIGDPYVKDKNDLSKLIHIKDCAVGGSFFGKRKVFEELNGFADISYSEDSEFLERAAKQFNIKKVDFPTYIYYRDTPLSICNTIHNESK